MLVLLSSPLLSSPHLLKYKISADQRTLSYVPPSPVTALRSPLSGGKLISRIIKAPGSGALSSENINTKHSPCLSQCQQKLRIQIVVIQEAASSQQ